MNAESIGLLACAGAAASAVSLHVRPAWRPRWTNRWGFTLLLAAALLIFQRDAIRANFQLWNPDESQMIAGALVLQERPVFWRDVDGTTHGPLDQLPLLLPALGGARIDYTSARLVGAGLTVLLLVFSLQALSRRLDEGTARLLVLPGWALFIFNQDPEIAQYTSELPASLLIAIATALLPSATSKPSVHGLLAAGIACGAAPLAKLQAAPLSAWLLLWCGYSIWREPPGHRRGRFGLLIAGALLPWLFFVGTAAATGAFEDFRIRYLETNLLGYASEGHKYFNDALPLPGMLFGFGWFLWPVTAGILVSATTWLLRRNHPAPGFLVLAAGLTVAALVAIYFPRKPFAHYFILLVGPLLLLLGATTGSLLRDLTGSLTSTRRTIVAVLLLGLLAAPPMIHHFRHQDYERTIVASRPPVPRELIEALQRHTRPGDSLSVWGWQPALYVFTQTVAATPDLLIFWQVVPSRWLDFYQARYLRDLRSHPPAVFVDTMGPADFFHFRSGAATRHENFPALREFIARHYVQVESVADSRIYVLRNRTVTP